MTFLDKTFCASPNCINECGHKMSDEEKDRLNIAAWKNPDAYSVLVAWAYFCGKPELLKTSANKEK